ncbi:hypothetical protein Tco_0179317 [Tanacetum coccineum]
MSHKAPKPSSQSEEVPQGKKLGAKSGLKRKQSSKHTSDSKTEASKSKTGQSEKETQSISAKDKTPSHPSPPTQVVDQTKSARDGLKTAHTDSGTNEESRVDEISKKIKLKDLSDLLKDIRSTFFTPDSLQDEPIIVSDESEEEEEVDKDNDTHATSHDVPEDTLIPHPPSPKLDQIQELMAHELPLEFQALPSQVSSVQENSDFRFPSKSLQQANCFTSEGGEEPPIQYKDVNDEPNMHKELVDLLGIDVVTQYYNKKLLYDKYCDKMLKRRKSSKITNCDVLTQKGHISLKVHREDGTNEVISNVKVSDLHMAE